MNSIHSNYSLAQLGWKAHFQHQLSLDDLESNQMARVAVVERSQLTLLTTEGAQSLSINKSMPAMTVGDWILINPEGMFVRLLERMTWFSRKAAGTEGYRQLIAANIDTVFIVSSLNQDFNLNRIERYLALAHEAGVEPVIVLTKADLCDQPDIYMNQVQALDAMLAVVALDARDAHSFQQLTPWIVAGQTVAFLGSSGVGKSTLVNTALGNPLQKTHSIREDDAKGRHTTTSRSMHLLPSGGVLLDTPGMRELQLADCEQGVDETFPDILELESRCRFSDCQHQSEPGCAVQEAIERGKLDQRRLNNYLKLKREQAFNSASLAERKANDKSFGKMVKSVMQEKQNRKRSF